MKTKFVDFCLDFTAFYSIARGCLCSTYDNMDEALRVGTVGIKTLSLAHLSANLIEKGYTIFLCKGRERKEIKDGMPLSDGSVLNIKEHNLLDLLRAGKFDKLLNT